MKAPVRLLQNVGSALPAAWIFAGVAVCSMLSGCIGNPFGSAQIDPRSPVAGEAAKALHSRGAFPKFADIPHRPSDVRPRAQYGAQAAQVEATRQTLEAATAPSTWTLTQTDSFEARAQQAAGPATPPGDPAMTAAFANALRKRATPPPPPKR